MKVDLTKVGLEPPESGRAARTAAGESNAAALQSAEGAAHAAGADKVRISFDKARVASLARQALGQPEVREAKVRRLQQSVQAGGYSVPAGDVADAIARDLDGN